MKRKTTLVTMTFDMHAALSRQAARRGASVAGLIRAVMGEWLEGQGEVVDWAVTWGGRRPKADDSRPEGDAD